MPLRFASRAAEFIAVTLVVLVWVGYEVEGVRTFLLAHFWLLALLALVGFGLVVFSATSYWKRATSKGATSSQHQSGVRK